MRLLMRRESGDLLEEMYVPACELLGGALFCCACVTGIRPWQLLAATAFYFQCLIGQ